ncbi:tRNA (adenosine(37)-N6)-threonylcarbamoyltransferase complex ATPase subunit type 1 TsaE [Poritiphilus flavus]|uniref:tRNA threonylcarbamoyladenosine biosynthesis protein TsaE n=1 Tax=Poritiphilus flavus TaxID=2697053 RepID=A0A6L9EFY4_9FLAO|nr:tRNA (adenosine(37)-N6)-threonylcarbamoyltransferase complex ATPase subunit type 1 TsaE [Poritiphilus flavus]NAS13601.1 tRNA (adenosine(37)-N6)-threonylcarbamoyltransferase complex ATPase subunit type 1 TsaE [Poritiphilus flavus]
MAVQEMTFSLEEIRNTAKEIIRSAPARALCFYGEMGAGKTTLIKAIVKELGGSEAQSPTFGLVNEYEDSEGGLLGYHFDFYRIESEEEALDLGLEDYFSQDAWIFIEWPEKIPSLLPENCIPVYIQVIDDNTREIRLS